MIPNNELRECPEVDSRKLVELIGGPLDGLLKQWHAGAIAQSFDYYGGEAEYGYEGNNKAVYLQG